MGSVLRVLLSRDAGWRSGQAQAWQARLLRAARTSPRLPNGLTLWIDPYTSKIVVGQFSRQEGADPRLNTVSRIPPAFDGKWMWVDGNGEPQPKPALFVGLFRADNPYLEQLQTTYKDLALAMRKGTCNTCQPPKYPTL
jgi:hypothetical protein